MTKVKLFAALLLALLLAQIILPGFCEACPSCYGAADSKMTEGMNMGILALLGVTGGVLAAFGGFFLRLRKKSAKFNQRFTNMLN